MSGTEGANSNKPQSTAFKQQQLSAWQPILTPNSVILTFAAVGAVFLLIGILVLIASGDVVEVTSADYKGLTPGAGSCTAGANSTSTSCLVDVSFTIPEDMKQPIYMYYQLKNFYQNHRRYVKSRSDVQLRNDGMYEVSGSCEPLATRSCSNGGTDGTCAVYPCGLIAWSVFNDTFYSNSTAGDNDHVTILRDGQSIEVAWTPENIAWSSDKEKKFLVASDPTPVGSLPSGEAPTDATAIALPYDSYKYFKCTNTSVNLSDCELKDRYADVANEEFIVWMRTSGLPDFRKLHRIIKTDLKKGDMVTLKINNVFPVSAFGGEKKVVFSTTTWIGGKNEFLGWAYIVVAILCILLAIAFAIKQFVFPRSPASAESMNAAGTASSGGNSAS